MKQSLGRPSLLVALRRSYFSIFAVLFFSGFFFLNLLLWFSSLQTVYPIPNKYNSFYLFSKFHFISNLTKLILIQQQQHLINSSNFYHKSSTKLKNPNNVKWKSNHQTPNSKPQHQFSTPLNLSTIPQQNS